MAVSSGRPNRFIVYQRGRGQEPVTVEGSIRSFVAVNAILFSTRALHVKRSEACTQELVVCSSVGSRVNYSP
jgi:hypothetical protein